MDTSAKTATTTNTTWDSTQLHEVNGTEASANDMAEDALSEFESGAFAPVYRPVTIVNASEPKRLDLRVEVPVEDMARLAELDELPSGPASQGPVRRSIWSYKSSRRLRSPAECSGWGAQITMSKTRALR